MGNTIELKYENDEGEEVVLTLPAKMEVCWDCQGHGTVMTQGMREHAYSAEEFNESFSDEEDREVYFNRGGKYDVDCPTCHGKNVMPEVNEAVLSVQQKAEYAIWQKHDEDMARGEAEDRAIRRMENGGYD